MDISKEDMDRINKVGNQFLAEVRRAILGNEDQGIMIKALIAQIKALEQENAKHRDELIEPRAQDEQLAELKSSNDEFCRELSACSARIEELTVQKKAFQFATEKLLEAIALLPVTFGINSPLAQALDYARVAIKEHS